MWSAISTPPHLFSFFQNAPVPKLVPAHSHRRPKSRSGGGHTPIPVGWAASLVAPPLVTSGREQPSPDGTPAGSGGGFFLFSKVLEHGRVVVVQLFELANKVEAGTAPVAQGAAALAPAAAVATASSGAERGGGRAEGWVVQAQT